MSDNISAPPGTVTGSEAATEGFWNRIIAILSVIIVGAVAFLILGPRPEVGGSLDVSALPFVNMTLNSITTVLLLIAFWFIRARRIGAHKNAMLLAFGTSTAFLVTYVIYHWFKAGPRAYAGDWTTFYYVVLISHIVLAIFVVPLALTTLHRGWIRQDARHRALAKVSLPIWLYVSVTGVLLYVLLYP